MCVYVCVLCNRIEPQTIAYALRYQFQGMSTERKVLHLLKLRLEMVKLCSMRQPAHKLALRDKRPAEITAEVLKCFVPIYKQSML